MQVAGGNQRRWPGAGEKRLSAAGPVAPVCVAGGLERRAAPWHRPLTMPLLVPQVLLRYSVNRVK